MNAIEASGLTRRFAAVTAVRDLTLAIPAGCLFALLGPNGAGKSTTIRLLVGLLRADAGAIRICGEPAGFRRPGARRLFGYLPEDVRMTGWMTAREYLEFTGALCGLLPADRVQRAGELLRFVGLEDTRLPLATYSKGMRQRLGLAQALVGRPRVLVLDEPASGLDPLGRREILHTIRDLQRDVTIVMSTHILEDAERICDRAGILDHGTLVREAPIADLRRVTGSPWITLAVEGGGDLAGRLWDLPSVIEVVRETEGYRVRVRDRHAGEREILGLVHAAGVPLVRYELAEPRLEDVFVETVRPGAADARPAGR